MPADRARDPGGRRASAACGPAEAASDAVCLRRSGGSDPAFHSATGHAAVGGDFSRAELLQFLHLSGMALWTGGVIVSGFFVVPRLVASGGRADGAYLQSLSRVSTYAVAVVLLSGASRDGPDSSGIWRPTPYRLGTHPVRQAGFGRARLGVGLAAPALDPPAGTRLDPATGKDPCDDPPRRGGLPHACDRALGLARQRGSLRKLMILTLALAR